MQNNSLFEKEFNVDEFSLISFEIIINIQIGSALFVSTFQFGV